MSLVIFVSVTPVTFVLLRFWPAGSSQGASNVHLTEREGVIYSETSQEISGMVAFHILFEEPTRKIFFGKTPSLSIRSPP